MRPDDLPDSIKRLNPQIFAADPRKPAQIRKEGGKTDDDTPKAIPAIMGGFSRHKVATARKLNKTEERFRRDCLRLEAERGDAILAQCLRLPLTGGGTYTPDYVVVGTRGVTCYEVKGGYRGAGWEQGYERFKRAAYEWARPYLRFVMATWDSKAKVWKMEAWNG